MSIEENRHKKKTEINRSYCESKIYTANMSEIYFQKAKVTCLETCDVFSTNSRLIVSVVRDGLTNTIYKQKMFTTSTLTPIFAHFRPKPLDAKSTNTSTVSPSRTH